MLISLRKEALRRSAMLKAILFNDTSSEHHIGCDTVIRNIKQLCLLHDIEIVASFTRNESKVPNKCDQAIKDCDLIIINGEGTLHDSYGKNFLAPLLVKIPIGKKAVLINSVWSNVTKVANLDKLSLISLRESNSLRNYIKDYPTCHVPVTVTPDVIFWRPPIKDFNMGYGDSVYGNIAKKLAEKGNYCPLDYKRKHSVKKRGECSQYASVDAYIRWLRGLDMHVTGRFHGVCLCAMAGTPFVALRSNAKKIEGILADMGCDELLIENLGQVNSKKEVAFELAPSAHVYATIAHGRVERLFERIGKIAHE